MKKEAIKQYDAFLRDINLQQIIPTILKVHRPSQFVSAANYAYHVTTAGPLLTNREQTPSGLRVTADHALTIDFHHEKEPELNMKIEICVSASYLCKQENKNCEGDIDNFVKGNVALHTWPYLRVFVSDLLSHMNLPPVPLPLFLMLRKTKPEKATKEKATKAKVTKEKAKATKTATKTKAKVKAKKTTRKKN